MHCEDGSGLELGMTGNAVEMYISIPFWPWNSIRTTTAFLFLTLEQVVEIVLSKRWFRAWLGFAVDWFAIDYVAW